MRGHNSIFFGIGFIKVDKEGHNKAYQSKWKKQRFERLRLCDDLQHNKSSQVACIEAYRPGFKAQFGSKKYMDRLAKFLQAVTTVSLPLDITDGPEGIHKIQDNKTTPKHFSKHVHQLIRDTVSAEPKTKTKHLYFLYHPATHWRLEFANLVTTNPLPTEFVGMSDSLDGIVYLMKFFRHRLNRKKGKPDSSAVFHLILPADQSMWIRDPLAFPDLGKLVIHGEKAGTKEYVWLNLPTLEDYPGTYARLEGVGNMTISESIWRNVAVGATETAGMLVTAAAVVSTGTIAQLLHPLSEVRSEMHRTLRQGRWATKKAVNAVDRYLGEQVPRVLGEPERVATSDDDNSDNESINSTTAEYGDSNMGSPRQSWTRQNGIPPPTRPARDNRRARR